MFFCKAAVAAALAASAVMAHAQHTMKLSTPTINDVTIQWMNAFKQGVESRSGGKHGGQNIALPPAEVKRYLELTTSVIPGLVANNPQLREDYEALQAAARKYRQ